MITHDSLLSRLRKAVKKVKFLLNFNLNRWRLAKMIGAASSEKKRRPLSFNDRPGLRACTDEDDDDDDDDEASTQYYSPDSTRGGGGGGSSSSITSLHRTISYPSEDDIDKRAEMFIANFHKQLQIERQISLELRYSNNKANTSP